MNAVVIIIVCIAVLVGTSYMEERGRKAKRRKFEKECANIRRKFGRVD